MSSLIYHIVHKQTWQATREKGVYSPESLSTEGFIHCSGCNQVIRVANTFYRAQADLVLLEIDPEHLISEIRWEPGTDKEDELFPHIFGSLNLDAVQRVFDFFPDHDGLFELPKL